MYFDHHSTTPIDTEVLSAMMPFLTENYGNSASRNHHYGWEAQKAVEESRKQVASVIGAQSSEITFTSGATESNNLAILGFARANKTQGNHIIVGQIEHKSVLESAYSLRDEGFEVSVAPCNSFGFIESASVEKLIRPSTLLISVQAANNEIGTIQPLKEIGELARSKNITFHTDLSQALTTVLINKNEIYFDLASFTAHKIYGPKGVGALFVRQKSPRIKIKPLQYGGGHEKGLRSGTLPVASLVGFAKACSLATKYRAQDYENLKLLRDTMEQELLSKIEGIKINGKNRLPHNLNFTLPEYVNTDVFLKKITPLAVSTGAACTTAQIEPSFVLKALGLSDQAAARSIRIGLGRRNTREEVLKAAHLVVDACQSQR